eukprot:766480-Hanusia_phi.AAC.19
MEISFSRSSKLSLPSTQNSSSRQMAWMPARAKISGDRTGEAWAVSGSDLRGGVEDGAANSTGVFELGSGTAEPSVSLVTAEMIRPRAFTAILRLPSSMLSRKSTKKVIPIQSCSQVCHDLQPEDPTAHLLYLCCAVLDRPRQAVDETFDWREDLRFGRQQQAGSFLTSKVLLHMIVQQLADDHPWECFHCGRINFQNVSCRNVRMQLGATGEDHRAIAHKTRSQSHGP